MKYLWSLFVVTVLKPWMASRAHFWVFKKIARVGYFAWIAVPVVLLEKPWYEICIHYGWGLKIYVPIAIVLGILAVFVTLTCLLHYPSKTSPIFMAVEIAFEKRVGIHMWKQFPTKEELDEMMEMSLATAVALGIPVISVQSPLFVKKGRLNLWKAMVKKSLAQYPQYCVELELVPPSTLGPFRSLCFNFSKSFFGFDLEKKHLPEAQLFSVPTAGFKLRISKS